MRIEVQSIGDLPAAAAKLMTALEGRRIVALEGEMGAGKTTLVAALCKMLGMDEEASSPTFSIVNEYENSETGQKIYHFDFYRISNLQEALDLGLDDYFDSGSLCLMEWSGNVASLLPEETAIVRLRENPDGSRTLSVDEES